MEIQITQKMLRQLKFMALITAMLLVVISGVVYMIDRNSRIAPRVGGCVPTFYDGDGPYYVSNSPFRINLAPENPPGKKLILSGRLLNSDCTRILANAVIDIWQADHTGTYVNEHYRGRINTDNRGEYYFETVVPKGYGEGTGYRPPHIHYKIWVANKLLVTSEIFFEDTRDKPGFNNAYIVTLEEADNIARGKYDIVVPDYL